MNKSTETKKQQMIERLTSVAGVPVDLTVRGLRQFTISTEVVNESAANRIAAFFGALAKVTISHDQECGSFVYVDA